MITTDSEIGKESPDFAMILPGVEAWDAAVTKNKIIMLLPAK